MHRSIIEKLDIIPLPELFNYYHVDWVEGRNFRCPFPTHGATGTTPSFRYYPETNSASCFGCHKGGGPVHFVMNMEGISYVQACDKLMGMYNIENLPEFSYQSLADKNQQRLDQRDERMRFGILSDVLAKIDPVSDEDLKKFSFLYSQVKTTTGDELLQLSIDALSLPLSDFIEKIPQTVKDTQMLGIAIIKTLKIHAFESDRLFNPRPLHSGFFNEQLCNISWPSQNNRYVFPIFLPGKVIAGFSGRTLNPNETLKYQTELLFGLSKKDLMFGLDVALPYIREMGCCIVVEGILDAVRCWDAGFMNTVAPCCSYVSDNLALLLKGITKDFILLQDNDYGGDQEAALSEKALRRNRLNSKRVLVPEGEDPDSYGMRDLSGLSDLLKSAVN